MHLCSPPDAEEEIAVLIILEAGQELMQTKVGMSFKEIQSVLGEPDYGPLPMALEDVMTGRRCVRTSRAQPLNA